MVAMVMVCVCAYAAAGDEHNSLYTPTRPSVSLFVSLFVCLTD